MGPSWYLMPDIFEHYFELVGERVEDWLTLKRLDPSYRVFWKDDGRRTDIHSDLERDIPTLNELEPGAGEKFIKYLNRAKSNYEIATSSFIYKNYDSILDFMTPQVAVDGLRLSVFTPMFKYVSKFFKTDEVQKIMLYTLVFLGSSPYNTPALYSIMTHIDFNMGVFYPMGGMYELAKAIAGIAKKNGVELRVNSPVDEILTVNGRATGVRLADGSVIEADIVVSNADVAHTELQLLKKAEDRSHDAKYFASRTLAPSGFIMFLGLKDKVPSLTHHNLAFSKDWQRNFAEIFDEPQYPRDPSYYVCAPSVTDPSVAPEGKENLFVLVPIAAGLEDTPEIRTRYAEQTLSALERDLNIPNIRERIEVQHVFTVNDFAARYNSYRGTALGLAHTLFQTAIFRPNTVSKKVKNLYYVGGNTNPGIGMPMCLVSAELVYKRLIGNKTGAPLKHL